MATAGLGLPRGFLRAVNDDPGQTGEMDIPSDKTEDRGDKEDTTKSTKDEPEESEPLA